MQAIVSAWQTDLKLDVRDSMGEHSEVRLIGCSRCSLEFFLPASLVGTPSLYTRLEKLDSYYIPRKWEHDVALEDLGASSNGIEIGCGFGDFLQRALERGKQFEGCEQNPSAVQVAQSRGLPVHANNLQQLAATRAGSYDVVCSFQVLEHVTDPASFLRHCSELLRPQGKLMLGLPNAESFLKHQFNVLDMPPHHMTRWRKAVLEYLPNLLPLRLLRVGYEPLPDYQFDAYLNAYAAATAIGGVRWLSHPRLRRHLRRLARRGLQRHLKGQTLYALYERR